MRHVLSRDLERRALVRELLWPRAGVRSLEKPAFVTELEIAKLKELSSNALINLTYHLARVQARPTPR